MTMLGKVIICHVRTATLLFLSQIFFVSAYSQKAQADEDGPKLISSPEAKFAPEGIALAIGGVIQVSLKIDNAGKPMFVKVIGPPAPCSNLDDPRAGALRDAAVAGAKESPFEPPGRETTTTLSFIVPYPSVPERDRQGRLGILGPDHEQQSDIGARFRYSPSVHRSKPPGMVTVMITLDYDGAVLGAAGVNGDPVLFCAASEAARRAKFPPITFSGIPYEVTGSLNYYIP